MVPPSSAVTRTPSQPRSISHRHGAADRTPPGISRRHSATWRRPPPHTRGPVWARTAARVVTLAARLDVDQLECNIIEAMRDVKNAATATCADFGITDASLCRMALAAEILRVCEEIDEACSDARGTSE